MATLLLPPVTERRDVAPVLSFDGRGRLGHAPSIEGLRGVAVAAVVVYHLRPDWLPGGFLGVEMFFVLSGFLIASLLLSEVAATGHVRVWHFLLRRARRLLPAMFAVVAVTCVLTGLLSPDIERARARRHAISTLTYSMNWRLVSERLSYTDLVAGQSPFRHMWSLAIEEQFYIAVALLLGVAVLSGVQLHRIRRGYLAVGSAVLAVAGVCAMWVLAADPARSNARAYYGTDARASGLLIGVGLAALIANREVGQRHGSMLRRVSYAGWAVLIVAMWRLGEQSSSAFHGGILLVSLATAAVIAGLQDQTLPRRLLEWPALRLLGRMSYSVYLWHWPVIVFVTSRRTGWSQPALDVLRVAIILSVSAVSMMLIERPFRRSTPAWDRPFDNILPLGLVGALLVSVVATRPPHTARVEAFVQPTAPAATTPATPAVAPPDPLATPPAATAPAVTAAAVTAPATMGAVIVGDSVAHTLAGGEVGAFPDYVPWSPSVSSFAGLPLHVQSLARPGCSFLPGDVARVLGDGSWTSVSLTEFCGNWQGDLDAWLDPSRGTDFVVTVLSNDLEDRAVDGSLVLFGSPEYEVLLMQFLDQLDARVRAGGATLVVVATPPRSDPPDTDEGGFREIRMRQLLGQFAAGEPSAIFVDLGQMVCPGDDCSEARFGFDPSWRYDGLHYDTAGARCSAEWLSAQLVDRDHQLDPSWRCDVSSQP